MKRVARGSYRGGWAVFVSAALLAVIAGAANLNGSGVSLNLSTSDLYSATAQTNANGGRLSSAGAPDAGAVSTNAAGARVIIEPINAVAGVSAGATAEFSANPISGGVPLEVQFADHSSGGLHGIVAWAWDFGDGSPVDTGQNPTHVYKTSGTYSVTLTIATRVDGAVKTKHAYIAVLPGVPAAGWGGMLMLAAALAAAGGMLAKKQAVHLALAPNARPMIADCTWPTCLITSLRAPDRHWRRFAEERGRGAKAGTTICRSPRSY